MSDLNTPYSPYKVAHHQDRLDQLKKGEQIYPSFVQMMISDLCNHNCHFCAYRLDEYTTNEMFKEVDAVSGVVNNNPNRMIPYEKCVQIIDDCVDMGVSSMEITGGGEPTVHPHHREIFQYAIDRGLKLGLVTNGAMFRKGILDILPKFEWVRVSVDCARPGTYASMREVSENAFSNTIKNICDLTTAKHETGSGVVIGVGFVVTKQNYKEIREAGHLFSKLGVDNLRLSAFFQNDDAAYFADIYDEARDSARYVVDRYSSDKFKVFNLFGDRVEDLESKNPDYSFCGFQQFQCIIGGDQNVYRCCNTAFNPMGLLGSVKEQSFKKLWDSDIKKKLIEEFDAKGCPRCMFNAKNRFINYLLTDNPSHVGFI